MKTKLTVDEVKQIELNILKYIDRVFNDNHIIYYLDSGTLLGAIRHHGFIPWDDDIDIIVKRKDYKRALDLLYKQNSQYKVLSRYYDPNYIYDFAKVVDSTTKIIEKGEMPYEKLGVYVDIFPLDSLPDSENERRRYHNKIYFYRLLGGKSVLWEMKQYPHNIKSRISCFFAHFYGWKRAIDKIDSLCLKNYNDKSKYSIDIVAARKRYMQALTSDFDTTINVQFEDGLFPAPVGYDDYLSALYGNYMELPPKNQRISNHDFIAYRE